MSVCKSIVCHDCKKHLWIGQTNETFYSGEPEIMEALRVFLFAHEDHPLAFTSNEWGLDGYEEINLHPSTLTPPTP